MREELRLYNPEFVRRPHVVALNKVDVLGESSEEWAQSIREGILAGAYIITLISWVSFMLTKHTA